MTAKEIYDEYVASMGGAEKGALFSALQSAAKKMAKELSNNPEAKEEVYNKTLDWVNEIRATRMVGQKPIETLMPGLEMEPNECIIATSLDHNYRTAVGGDLLEGLGVILDDANIPVSKGLTWYAEWAKVNPETLEVTDYGWEELPWFAYMVARGFDYGAFPELSTSSEPVNIDEASLITT